MNAPGLIVAKFGSSVLRTEADLPGVVAEVTRLLAQGRRVLAVVSAIGGSTDALQARAGHLGRAAGAGGDSTADAALAALLATGEAASAALLALALDQAGLPSAVLDAGRVGPFTRGPQLDAQPCAFDSHAVARALQEQPVAVLPGFVGRDEAGRFSLLGRGGSDLTALFAARSLGANRCRLLKDVDGIYESDPGGGHTGDPPRRFASLRWDDAMRLGGRVLQRKALQFARRHQVAFEVGRCGSDRVTVVGAGATERSASSCR